jgi:hypothetical protein
MRAAIVCIAFSVTSLGALPPQKLDDKVKSGQMRELLSDSNWRASLFFSFFSREPHTKQKKKLSGNHHMVELDAQYSHTMQPLLQF